MGRLLNGLHGVISQKMILFNVRTDEQANEEINICSITIFSTTNLHHQHLKFNTTDVRKIAKNGWKYV
jgi:lipoate-protein ligase B